MTRCFSQKHRVGIIASIAADAGYLVLIPLAGIAYLVAGQAGTAIYQDIATIPGVSYRWTLKHASLDRNHLDGMSVMIGEPGKESAQDARRTTVNGNGDIDLRVLGMDYRVGIIVEGEVNGNLSASDRIELKNSARYEGDLRASKLVVDEGGELCGEINVLNDSAAPATKPRAVLETVAPRSVASA